MKKGVRISKKHLFLVSGVVFAALAICLGVWLNILRREDDVYEEWIGLTGYEDEPATWKRIDEPKASDFIWESMLPIEAEESSMVNTNSYLVAGISAKEMQTVLDNAIETRNFPSDTELNSNYKWMAYKPRVIPKHVYETCIVKLLEASKLKEKYKCTLAKERVIHANVSAEDKDYLLTIQILLQQPNNMYSKVIQFTTLGGRSMDKNKNETIVVRYRDAKVIGVVHEQNKADKASGWLYAGDDNTELYGLAA